MPKLWNAIQQVNWQEKDNQKEFCLPYPKGKEMNQQDIAKLILEGITKERFRIWHGEGGRFERYITGEEKPDEAEILDDIIDLFKIPEDKESEVPQYVGLGTREVLADSAIVDEINDIGIVLEDGRQLTFRDIANILHELARSKHLLPKTSSEYHVSRLFNQAGDVAEEIAEAGERKTDVPT